VITTTDASGATVPADSLAIAAGHSDRAVRLVCAFLHRLATERPGTPESGLALDLAAELDDLRSRRARAADELLRALEDDQQGGTP
jgi:hypothetical protein